MIRIRFKHNYQLSLNQERGDLKSKHLHMSKFNHARS